MLLWFRFLAMSHSEATQFKKGKKKKEADLKGLKKGKGGRKNGRKKLRGRREEANKQAEKGLGGLGKNMFQYKPENRLSNNYSQETQNS